MNTDLIAMPHGVPSPRVLRTLGIVCALAGLTAAGQTADRMNPEARTDAGGQTNLYLVIDLAPRGAMKKLPVSYLADVPAGGWTDEYKSTKMVLRRIPAGTFKMGSPTGELGREPDETQHHVTFTSDYYIGIFEVTQKQWERVMGASAGRYINKTSLCDVYPVEQVSYFQVREAFGIPPEPTGGKEPPAATSRNTKPETPKPPAPLKTPTGIREIDGLIKAGDAPTALEGESAPAADELAEKRSAVIQEPRPYDDPVVDWPANAEVNPDSFLGRLRRLTGLTALDLPTEAQWEYACRAGTATALHSGKDVTDPLHCPHMAQVGAYRNNMEQPEGRVRKEWLFSGGLPGCSQDRHSQVGTAAVGSYLPNSWGLYDMHGNVWEWCLDWYTADYPATATDPKGPATGTVRVLRGGSWEDDARTCRAANRGVGGNPFFRNGAFGFRVAMTAP